MPLISVACLAGSVLLTAAKPLPSGQSTGAVGPEPATVLPTLVLKQKGLGELAFSPGGERLVSRMADGSLVAWELASGTRSGPSFAVGHRGSASSKFAALLPVAFFEFTPDGKHVVALSAEAVSIWDAATGELVLSEKGLKHATATPDRSLVAYQVRDGFALWDVSSRRLRGDPIHGELGSFSRDARALLYRADSEIRIYTFASGRSVVLPSHDVKRLAWWAWGLDATTLAALDNGSSPIIWNLAADPPLPRATLKPTGNFPTFSHDGRFFATSVVGSVTLHDLAEADPRPHTLEGPHSFVNPYIARVSFAPKEPILAVQHFKGFALAEKNYRVQLWDLKPLPPALLETIPQARMIGFSRDGAILAYRRASGGIGLWSSKSRKTVAALETGRNRVGCWFSESGPVPEVTPFFSPDTAWFACVKYESDEILVWDLRPVR